MRDERRGRAVLMLGRAGSFGVEDEEACTYSRRHLARR